jgi:hypothetical protein
MVINKKIKNKFLRNFINFFLIIQKPLSSSILLKDVFVFFTQISGKICSTSFIIKIERISRDNDN